jgi:hypothetical protein
MLVAASTLSRGNTRRFTRVSEFTLRPSAAFVFPLELVPVRLPLRHHLPHDLLQGLLIAGLVVFVALVDKV